MTRNPFMLFLFLCFYGGTISAQVPAASATEEQEKKITVLTQQNTSLRTALSQARAEKAQLLSQIASLQKSISTRIDSIREQQRNIAGISTRIDDQHTELRRLEQIIATREADVKAAGQKVSSLEYDKKNLIDSRVIRLYNFPAAEVRKQFLQSLKQAGTGFQYDDTLIDDQLLITRDVNDPADAWWVTDKTPETRLELKLRIKPHLYDPQRCVVTGETRLLQKARYGNKPFEEQTDQDKIRLYREKTLRLLEGRLQGTSDK